MGEVIRIREVFKSTGQPTATYVRRRDGEYERSLLYALENKGQICLLTGASKTGKTTLYRKVLSDRGLTPLVVRCDLGVQAQEFWRKALEGINFERVSVEESGKSTSVESSGKVGLTFGWKWLAETLGEFGFAVGSTSDERILKERILAKPSPEHLLPVLKKLPFVLVIEDFHYLKPAVQENIFQQWKLFVDNEVTVVVVGTTHHAIDLAYANKDLVGRISQIDMQLWSEEDLKKIAKQGFDYLKVTVSSSVMNAIAGESAGLPLITQNVCAQLFTDRQIVEIEVGKGEVIFSSQETYTALYNVAKHYFIQFEAIYERLTKGPRKGARKYNTYELVLSVFTQDPLAFSLGRDEIEERLLKIPISEEEMPPAGSIDSMLNALAGFQKQANIELLEWRKREQKLFILEPSFLFYLRWRSQHKKPPSTKEILLQLLKVVKDRDFHRKGPISRQ